MFEKIRIIILIIELAVLALEDMRTKKISLKLLLFMLVSAVAMRTVEIIYYDETNIKLLIYGVLFGMSIAAFGYLSGAIGTGDGLVVILISLMTNKMSSILIFLYAMTIAAVVSVILLCLKKVKRKYEIPFVPFMFFSFIGALICM